MPGVVDVVITLDGCDLAPEERAELARRLRGELLDATDAVNVAPASGGAPPEGAKAGSAVDVGALVVSLAPEVFAQAVAVIAAWLRRQRCDVEVEIGGHRFKGQVTPQEQQELLAAFLDRVNAGKAS